MRDYVFSLDAACVAVMLCAPVAAHADMYKWTAEDGTVTYSNQLPTDRSTVKDFIKIEDIASVPSEVKAGPQAAEGEKRSSDNAVATPTPRTPALPPAVATTPAASVAQPVAAQPYSAPRAATRGVQTHAVQDPCLRSSDPQCYEKNRDKYHPYLGYAPGAGRAAPVGATSAAPAGGAVGGRVGASAR